MIYTFSVACAVNAMGLDIGKLCSFTGLIGVVTNYLLVCTKYLLLPIFVYVLQNTFYVPTTHCVFYYLLAVRKLDHLVYFR